MRQFPMGDPSEETLVEFVLGVLPRTQYEEVLRHLEASQVGAQVVAEYREIVAALQIWQDVSPEAAAALSQDALQRIRLRRLLDRLFADADLRRQAGQNPEAMLTAHGIVPTPQLLAAFKDLSLSSPERFPGELDERITKFRLLLEFFPGMNPGPLG